MNFELKFFVQVLLKFFYGSYVKGELNIALYARKKNRDIRIRIHENIGKNVLGGETPFFPHDADLTYESHDV